MKFASYVSEYEKSVCKRLGQTVTRYIENLDVTFQHFENKGRNDASKGFHVPPDDVFWAWGKSVFCNDPELAEITGELARISYMDGFNGIEQT